MAVLRRRRPRALLITANRVNLGDLVAGSGVRSLLAERRVPVDEAFCDQPWQEELPARLAALAPDDLVIVGPGGLLMDYFDPLWQALAAAGPRTVLWGTGSCLNDARDTAPDADALGLVAGRCEAIAVRDRVSADLVGPDAEVSGCPAFAAPELRPGRTRTSRSVLAVHHPQLVPDEAWAPFAELARRTAARRGLRATSTDNILTKPSRRQVRNILDDYRQAGLVLTSRLHGCIIGVALGKPVVAVSADRKVEAFMTEAGLDDYVVTPDRVAECERLLARIDQQPRADDYRSRVRAAQVAMADRVVALLQS